MTRITLDTNTSTQLHTLQGPAELCDPFGRVLGRFVPGVDLSEWEPVSPQASEEELDRRCQPGRKRYTTAEVMAYLENL